MIPSAGSPQKHAEERRKESTIIFPPPPASAEPDALPRRRPSSRVDALRAVSPSQSHRPSAPSAPLRLHRHGRHEPSNQHHRRRRHANIPKWHCQGSRSHEGWQTSEGSCSRCPGASCKEGVVLEGRSPRTGRCPTVLGRHLKLVNVLVAPSRPSDWG